MTIISFPEARQGCCCSNPEWLTLPVAPQATARTRFAGEDKLPQAVPLQGALTWLADLTAQGKSIAGLNLNGPGDPLATPAMTLQILAGLREQYPQLALGIITIGLGLAEQAGLLAEHGVSKITLLLDARSPKTIKKIYSWIRPGKRSIPLAEGADILIAEQAKGIAACKAAGIPVCIRTTVYAGINEKEVEEIARGSAALGAETISLLPGKGWLDTDTKLPPPAAEAMAELTRKVAGLMTVVCLPEETAAAHTVPLAGNGGPALPKPTAARPNVAVLSANGMDIDLHLGQAIKALIYGPREDGLACLLEARDLPEPGDGDNRWLNLSEILKDCFALLATSAGQRPREILSSHGLTVLLLEDNVEGAVDVLYGGGKKGKNR